MTKDEFDKVMSDSAQWIIEMVCDADHQVKNSFPRKHLTIGDMFTQDSYIMEVEA